jgi:hypothetical protein
VRRQIQIHRIAELEINRAIIWYSEKAGLGRAFRAEVNATLEKIRKNPLGFPISFQHARRAMLDRFSYKIFFTIEDDNVIKVFGVLHANQSTDRLFGRLP